MYDSTLGCDMTHPDSSNKHRLPGIRQARGGYIRAEKELNHFFFFPFRGSFTTLAHLLNLVFTFMHIIMQGV